MVLRWGTQDSLLRGLEGLSLDVVLANFSPARDASSLYPVSRLDDQPISLVGTPSRASATRQSLVELGRLEDVREIFWAVTIRRRFPNPLLKEVRS